MDGIPKKADRIILDTYCGAGGVARGLVAAGWVVVGVDNDPAKLRQYPYAHYLGDALEFIHKHGHEFHAIWASPDCRGYSRATINLPDRLDRYDREIAAVRDLLVASGKPYVIENVGDARPELLNPYLLCGRMFNLSATDTDGTHLVLDRHRYFETNWPMWQPEHTPHYRDEEVQVAGLYGMGKNDKQEAKDVGAGYVPSDGKVLADLLGIERGSMTRDAMYKAIPPAYSHYIGAQLLDWCEHLDGQAMLALTEENARHD